jgi:predicted HD phosphohydrolase
VKHPSQFGHTSTNNDNCRDGIASSSRFVHEPSLRCFNEPCSSDTVVVTTPTTVDELFALYESTGDVHYGESITQLEHALQTAALAKMALAGSALIAAALFHDVGHLVVDVQANPSFDLERDNDDHEAVGARVLAPIFGASVAQPVALHVTAKRWRCTRDPQYLAALSYASRATLVAQGGPLSEEACQRFEAHPGFHDAVALREWDDTGKVPGLDVGTLRQYEGLVRTLAELR